MSVGCRLCLRLFWWSWGHGTAGVSPALHLPLPALHPCTPTPHHPPALPAPQGDVRPRDAAVGAAVEGGAAGHLQQQAQARCAGPACCWAAGGRRVALGCPCICGARMPRHAPPRAGTFWGANQRFWKQMLMVSEGHWWRAGGAGWLGSAPAVTLVKCLLLSLHRPRTASLSPQACKVPNCAALALKAVEDGMAVVIGLQSTGALSAAVQRRHRHARPLHSGRAFTLAPCTRHARPSSLPSPSPPLLPSPPITTPPLQSPYRRGQHRATEGPGRRV